MKVRNIVFFIVGLLATLIIVSSGFMFTYSSFKQYQLHEQLKNELLEKTISNLIHEDGEKLYNILSILVQNDEFIGSLLVVKELERENILTATLNHLVDRKDYDFIIAIDEDKKLIYGEKSKNAYDNLSKIESTTSYVGTYVDKQVLVRSKPIYYHNIFLAHLFIGKNINEAYFSDLSKTLGVKISKEADRATETLEQFILKQQTLELGQTKITYYTYTSKQFKTQTIHKLAILAISSVLIAIVITFFLTKLLINRYVTKPVENLYSYIRKLTDVEDYSAIDLKEFKGLQFKPHEFDSIYKGLQYLTDRVKKSSEEIKEQSKMAAIGQTTAMLAHDVRKPFTSLKAALNMFESFKKDRKSLEAAKKEIDKAIKNVDSMVADIIDFSRDVKVETKPNSVVSILDFSIRQASQMFKNNDINFAYKIENQLMPMADEERLARAFLNIMVNAFEAITIIGQKKSGKIWITTRDITKKDKKYIEVIIGNNGPAINEDDMQMLFKSFFTKGKGKGTGLGLASANKIINLHEGEIVAKNIQNRGGVEFQVLLPSSSKKEAYNIELLPHNVADATGRETLEADTNVKKIIGKLIKEERKYKIILLEDEALYRASVRNTIESHDDLDKLITLYEAQNVEDALKLVEHEKATHAIVDIDLKDVQNGFDFIVAATKVNPNIKVIVHSNRNLPDEVNRAESLGIHQYVPKPLSIEDLAIFLSENYEPKKHKVDDKIREKKKKILMYADDDYIMRLNMQNLIKEIDDESELHVFENAEKLYDKLSKLGDCEAVFTDYYMGKGMNGLDLVKKIKDKGYKCKIYLISNIMDSNFPSEADKSGIDGFFEAPIQKEQLEELLTRK